MDESIALVGRAFFFLNISVLLFFPFLSKRSVESVSFDFVIDCTENVVHDLVCSFDSLLDFNFNKFSAFSPNSGVCQNFGVFGNTSVEIF